MPRSEICANLYILCICLAKLVLASGNCPFVDRNIFDTRTGSPICLTETVVTIETESGSFCSRSFR